MKIHLVSDVHLEFGDHYTPTVEADAIIVAGDIHPKTYNLIHYLEELATKYKYILFVTGNHDYYKNDIDRTNKHLDEYFRNTNIYFLNNTYLELDGVTFFGGTMWTDGAGNHDKVLEEGLNDFWLIKDFTVKRMRELHEEFKKAYTKQADVVITHHLPDMMFVADIFKNSPINGGFACTDMKEYLNKAKVHCFGHTHHSYDNYFGKTRFLCNPVGYPGYISYVKEDLVFEV